MHRHFYGWALCKGEQQPACIKTQSQEKTKIKWVIENMLKESKWAYNYYSKRKYFKQDKLVKSVPGFA